MSYNLRHLKQVIYRLKREFGQPVLIQAPTTNTVNLVSGTQTRNYSTTQIRRAVVLEASVAKDFVYDLSFIAANKNFTMGGYFDKDVRIVIVENSDLLIEIRLADHVEIEQHRFEIKRIDKNLYTTMLLVQAVDGSETIGIRLSADTDLIINATVADE